MTEAEEEQAAIRRLRRGELFALWRCIFWGLNMPAAVYCYTQQKPLWLEISVLYLVVVSIYANAESAYASYSAKRGERRSLEGS